MGQQGVATLASWVSRSNSLVGADVTQVSELAINPADEKSQSGSCPVFGVRERRPTPGITKCFD
jgi:hypothetical protein